MRDTLRTKFFGQFVETALARTGASNTAVREDASDTACHELHSLAGECSMLGFDEIATLAREAEAEAKLWAAGDPSKRVRCGRTLRHLQRAIDELIASQDVPEPAIKTPTKDHALRALIIDDSEIVADQLQELLEERDVRCQIATTMEESMTQAKEFEPSIALVDLNMGSLDTSELVAGLQTTCPDAKIILVSGISNDELEQRCKELNVDDFVSKQAGISAVIDCVIGQLPELSR